MTHLGNMASRFRRPSTKAVYDTTSADNALCSATPELTKMYDSDDADSESMPGTPDQLPVQTLPQQSSSPQRSSKIASPERPLPPVPSSERSKSPSPACSTAAPPVLAKPPSRQRVVKPQPFTSSAGRRAVSAEVASTAPPAAPQPQTRVSAPVPAPITIPANDSPVPAAVVTLAPPQAEAASGPLASEHPRSVRVVMTDINAVNLEWDAPTMDPATVWLACSRVHILDEQRVLVDIHNETPEEERRWLIQTAVELYFPMRKRLMEVTEVIRHSFPGYSLAPLKPITPPPAANMRRSEFVGSGRTPVLPTPLELPRLTLPNPFRNTYRVLQYVDTGRRALWVPAGVVFDLASRGDTASMIHVGPEAAANFRSGTMNTMFVHALKRVMGTDVKATPEAQHAMERAQLRMLSFHPSQIRVRQVGKHGGIVDVELPAPRGLPKLPEWHVPTRVFFTQGTEYVFESAVGTPRWRLDEIKMILDEHIGYQIEAWDDIRRIIRAFAPNDHRVAKILVTPPACRRGYERRRFTPRVTRAGSGHGGVPRGQRAAIDLPRLIKAQRGCYLLEYPDESGKEPATLDCTGQDPKVSIHESARDSTMMVCWLFGIVATLFESK